MSGLVTEFVAEARDLVENAGKTLLDLEDNPGDQAALNTLFRYVHTIKGGAGLFEPPGMIPTLHAGEDLLDRLREGEMSLTSDMTDVLLRALDQVVVWLDMLETDGELDAGQANVGEALAKELRAFVGPNDDEGDGATEADNAAQTPLDWFGEVPASCHDGAEAAFGIEYTPEEGCFFSGANPLATVLAAPGRRWLSVVPREPWPNKAEFDPFCCNLVFRVVSVAPRDVIDTHFVYVAENCKIVELQSATPSPAASPREELAIELLTRQQQSLALEADVTLWPGRAHAAGEVLSRVSTNLGLTDIAVKVGPAVEEAINAGTPSALDTLFVAVRDRLTHAKPENDSGTSPDESAKSMKRASTAVKVDQDVLDTMMKLVGEMIVAKNALPFLVKRAEDVYGNRRLALEIKTEYESINRIVEDMQASVMQMRMVPVSQVFQRYQRLVRDLSRRLGKKISLNLEGDDTKADKNIVEELADPLVHLIRNACDHGLEPPQERLASGKEDTGCLTLAARQSEDSVIIAVKDDGRGINVDRVRKKAVENGLLKEQDVQTMDDKSALQLILAPGFSTAEQISDLSGRGVGMDVVNTMVKRSGGTMWIDSKPNEGSEISIALPMSMAVSQVMMFEVGPTLYGISIENIVETVRIQQEDIHRFKSVEQITLRERLIPLRRAREIFGLSPKDISGEDELSILVVRKGDKEIGLVVDRVLSEADVKLESIDPCLNTAGLFSGAALLGDGSIMLVINSGELF